MPELNAMMCIKLSRREQCSKQNANEKKSELKSGTDFSVFGAGYKKRE